MKYENEGMDCKKILIFLIYKFWLVILAAVIGAVIGGGIYIMNNVVLNTGREYKAESKLYLDFAKDESGEVYQHYNGYTWNDLMATTLILDTTMEYLPDTYTREEVIAATSAEILSDLRLLTITITTPDAARTAEILKATNRSLTDMGNREKEFIDIEVIKETEPEMSVPAPRVAQAALIGFMTALAFILIALALIYILDDRIYVPGDLKCVTDLPFVGFSFTDTEHKMSARIERLSEKFGKDLEQNRKYLAEELGTLMILDLDAQDGITEQLFKEARAADAALLVIPYGKIDRSSLAYEIERLAIQKCVPAGIIIKDPDMRFMKWYYNHL